MSIIFWRLFSVGSGLLYSPLEVLFLNLFLWRSLVSHIVLMTVKSVFLWNPEPESKKEKLRQTCVSATLTRHARVVDSRWELQVHPVGMVGRWSDLWPLGSPVEVDGFSFCRLSLWVEFGEAGRCLTLYRNCDGVEGCLILKRRKWRVLSKSWRPRKTGSILVKIWNKSVWGH